MKKLLITLIALGILVALPASLQAGGATDSADDSTTTEDTTADSGESTEEGAGDAQLADDIVIYVHADCPHCKKVEEFVTSTGLEDHVKYIQLKNNEANLTELQGLWEEFDVPAESQGWPFLIYGEGDAREYLVGDAPINSYLSERFSVTAPEPEATPPNYVLLGFGILAILGIVGYGVFSVKSDSKK